MSETAIGRMRADLEAKQAEVGRLQEELSSLQDEIGRLRVALSVIEKYEDQRPVRAHVSTFRAKGIQATVRKILSEAQARPMKRSTIIERVEQSLGKEVGAKSISNALVILSRKGKVAKLGGGMWISTEAVFERKLDELLHGTEDGEETTATTQASLQMG